MITPINRVLVMVLVMVLVCIPIIPFTLYTGIKRDGGDPLITTSYYIITRVSRWVVHGVVTEGSKTPHLA